LISKRGIKMIIRYFSEIMVEESSVFTLKLLFKSFY